MTDFRLLIDGQLVSGESTLEVINPATETVIAEAPLASAQQLDLAIAAAKRAFSAWSSTPISARRQQIYAIAGVLQNNVNELAHLLTSEQGKPLVDAKVEVQAAARFFQVMAAHDLPVKVIEENEARRVEAHRRALGVVAAIIPWNFPLLTISFKLPFALLAGNTVVIKPAPTTPLATLRFGELVSKLLPNGVLNIIADNNDLGPALTSHPDVRKISFTGATSTGRKVFASAAQNLARLTLELGGNDAAIVLDDVDPKKIAPAIFRSAFFNSGQVCLAIKRLYVHESVYDELSAELARLAQNAVLGDGLDPSTTIGPVQNRNQFEKLKQFIDDGRRNGNIIAGGRVPDRPGFFIEPTIVRDISDGCKLVDEEQFGPILPIIRFSDIGDAIRRANATNFGLGASVWSSDTDRAYALAGRLEAGTVWINKHSEVTPQIPFSGAKHSGFGIEFAEAGLEEFTQLQIINKARN